MEKIYDQLLIMSANGSAMIVAILLLRPLLKRAPRKFSYGLWALAAFRLLCPVSLSAPWSAVGILYSNVEALPYAGEGITTLARTDGTAAMLTLYPELRPVWLDWIPWILCAGALILLLLAVFSRIRLERRLEKAVWLEENVYLSDQIRSPFILGLLRPRIYLPFGLDEGDRELVLAHERFHLKHGDHWVRAVAFVVLSVYWFNPMCWVGFYYMTRDMESRCDEAVLTCHPDRKKEYCTVLLAVASNRRFPSPSPLSFGETGVEQRIRRILNWRKPALWVRAVAAVVCLGVMLLWGVNPMARNSPHFLTSAVSGENLMNQTAVITTWDAEGYPNTTELTGAELDTLLSALNQIPEEHMIRYTGAGAFSREAELVVSLTEPDLDTMLLSYGHGAVWLVLDSEMPCDPGQWLLADESLRALLASMLEN